MKVKGFTSLMFALVALCIAAPAIAQSDLPRVFLIDARNLKATREKITKHDPSVETAVAKIEADAKKVVSGGVYSVTTKGVTPPSGDKHDYMSQAPYFWPDPTKKDGLPYIRRDGERNPELK